ncbi:sigma-54 interaction domain-containing protein [Brevibacillus fluminis]|uniref:sigma-54 interaction domain-containing protein n=1 Tax=Brevibacillus fluminis TaxID=511487 RepID=UPI003F8BDAF8
MSAIRATDWEDVIDYIRDSIMITDTEGVVLYANKATEPFFLMTREELIGKSVFQMEKEKVFYPSITRQVLTTRKKQTMVQETKSGKKVLVTGLIIFDKRGRQKYVVSYTHDVTEVEQLKEYVTVMENEIKKVRSELMELRSAKEKKDDLFATSPQIIGVLSTAQKVAPYDTTVLLTGESGVGKNVIAKYIHTHSNRTGPLVEINCATIPEMLLESELFGYAPGAFTGANPKGSTGLVEQAEGGTLFLDEIGELPVSLQAKLLTLIQEKKFYRVGEKTPRHVDFRLIAATNVDLKEKVDTGRFRQDLFFRPSVIPIHIPPLRERKEDLLTMILGFTQPAVCRSQAAEIQASREKIRRGDALVPSFALSVYC